MMYDILICDTLVFDGSGAKPVKTDVALAEGRIATLGELDARNSVQEHNAQGLALVPGFIHVHTHDNTNVIRTPQMLPKLSQGVTTVVVGNCGISAAFVSLRDEPPDLRESAGHGNRFPLLQLCRLYRHRRHGTPSRQRRRPGRPRPCATITWTAWTAAPIRGMRQQLREALVYDAIGLSTGPGLCLALRGQHRGNQGTGRRA